MNSDKVAMGIKAPQPPPNQNDEPIVWDLVIHDMRERDSLGTQKYHTHLQPFNGREALIDAYQEVLDLAVYLRQLIYERYGEQYQNVKPPGDS
jgi:hypothetical protein